MLPKIIKKHISVLHSEKLNTQKKTFQLKTLFPKDCFSIIYKRNKNLKELNAPSIYPKKCSLEQAALLVVIIVIFARTT